MSNRQLCNVKIVGIFFSALDVSFLFLRRNYLNCFSCRDYLWNKIISKLPQPSSMSRLKQFWLELFQNNFRGLLQLVNIFQHVQCRWSTFEIISDVVRCEIEHWNYLKIISKYFYFTCDHGIAQTHASKQNGDSAAHVDCSVVLWGPALRRDDDPNNFVWQDREVHV